MREGRERQKIFWGGGNRERRERERYKERGGEREN